MSDHAASPQNADKTPGGHPMADWRLKLRQAAWNAAAATLDSLFKELEPDPALHAHEAQSLLHSASINPRIDTLRFVLGMGGVTVDKLNKQGFAASHLASNKGLEAHCRLLLQHDANPNTPDRNGYTPLMSACKEGHKGIICLWLEHGADIAASSATGQTPLLLAQASKNPGAVTALIAYGSGRYRIRDEELRVLPRGYAAARCGLTRRLLELLDNGEPTHDPRYENNVAEEAASCGHDETASATQAWIARQTMLKLSSIARASI